jgi:hypothetical protein
LIIGEEYKMRKSICRKGLILTIVVLLVGVNSISALGGITDNAPTKEVKASCFGGITSPATGYLYLFGNQILPLKSGKTIFLFGGIPVSANFTAEGAPIKTVQFYLDDILINEDTTVPYSLTLSKKHSGPATIKVTAIDILGRSASDTLTIDNYLKLI